MSASLSSTPGSSGTFGCSWSILSRAIGVGGLQHLLGRHFSLETVCAKILTLFWDAMAEAPRSRTAVTDDLRVASVFMTVRKWVTLFEAQRETTVWSKVEGGP